MSVGSELGWTRKSSISSVTSWNLANAFSSATSAFQPPRARSLIRPRFHHRYRSSPPFRSDSYQGRSVDRWMRIENRFAWIGVKRTCKRLTRDAIFARSTRTFLVNPSSRHRPCDAKPDRHRPLCGTHSDRDASHTVWKRLAPKPSVPPFLPWEAPESDRYELIGHPISQ